MKRKRVYSKKKAVVVDASYSSVSVHSQAANARCLRRTVRTHGSVVDCGLHILVYAIVIVYALLPGIIGKGTVLKQLVRMAKEKDGSIPGTTTVLIKTGIRRGICG